VRKSSSPTSPRELPGSRPEIRIGRRMWWMGRSDERVKGGDDSSPLPLQVDVFDLRVEGEGEKVGY
jgi:hypothetical protein